VGGHEAVRALERDRGGTERSDLPTLECQRLDRAADGGGHVAVQGRPPRRPPSPPRPWTPPPRIPGLPGCRGRYPFPPGARPLPRPREKPFCGCPTKATRSWLRRTSRPATPMLRSIRVSRTAAAMPIAQRLPRVDVLWCHRFVVDLADGVAAGLPAPAGIGAVAGPPCAGPPCAGYPDGW